MDGLSVGTHNFIANLIISNYSLHTLNYLSVTYCTYLHGIYFWYCCFRSSVRLGEWEYDKEKDCYHDECSNPPIDVPVEGIRAHKNYDPNSTSQENDIALLRLSRSVKYSGNAIENYKHFLTSWILSDFIKPICLPQSENLKNIKYDGINLVVAGWSKTENGNSSKSPLIK